MATISGPTSYTDPDACSSIYQSFFGLAHDELYNAFSKETHHSAGSAGGDLDDEKEKEKEKEMEKKEREIEKLVLKGVDKIEEVVTACHYNL